MRECHTAILERHLAWTPEHETEPFECGWAGEALFFLYSTAPLPADLAVEVEISADGRRWVRHGAPEFVAAGATGAAIVAAPGFGGWLRLTWSAEKTPSEKATAELDIYLVLKQ